jgi:hypothetical protein
MAVKSRDLDDVQVIQGLQGIEEDRGDILSATRAVVLHKVTSRYYLIHPYTHQLFQPGVPVEVEHLDGWIQSQIDANLMHLG